MLRKLEFWGDVCAVYVVFLGAVCVVLVVFCVSRVVLLCFVLCVVCSVLCVGVGAACIFVRRLLRFHRQRVVNPRFRAIVRCSFRLYEQACWFQGYGTSCFTLEEPDFEPGQCPRRFCEFASGYCTRTL